MDAGWAIQICYQEFPKGLETLIAALSIEVEYERLNVDGWCFQTPEGQRHVRLSSLPAATRQRFTLAHEVAHFILKNEPSGFSVQQDIFDPKSVDEREANELAANLLLPAEKLLELVPEPYIDNKVIRNIAKAAGVSEIVVALRIQKLSKRLNLDNVVIARITNSQVAWKIPFSITVSDEVLVQLFDSTSQMPGRTHRFKTKTGKLHQASAFVNPSYQFVFVHKINGDIAKKPFFGLTRKLLEERLFSDNQQFRNVLNGKISACKDLIRGMELEEAVSFMIEKYENPTGWPGNCYSLFVSVDCYNYLLIRLAEYV